MADTETEATSSDPRWMEYLRLDELVPAVVNPKGHSIPDLIASLERFGFVGAPELDERTGRLVVGHGRCEALAELRAIAGGERPQGWPDGKDWPPEGVTVDTSGQWRLPVQRGWHSANDDEADAYLVTANHLTTKGGWILDPLTVMLDELDRGPGLVGTGFDRGDLDRMLADLERDLSERPANEAQVPDEDAVPAPEALDVVPNAAPRRAEEGQIWRLGQHGLICGDSFDAAVVDRLLGGAVADLVLTDPPFAIYGSASGISSSVADDKMVRPFFERLFAMIEPRIAEFAHVYVHCDWRSWAAIWHGATRAGLHPKNCLVWDKGGAGLGSNWANTHEFIGYFAKLPPQKTMTSGAKAGQRSVLRSNLLRFNRAHGADRLHNAAKPTAMLGEIIEATSDVGALVLDLFAGSGSTLIACELTGRRCYTADLEPKMCDIVIDRWERATGRTAELVT